MNTNVSAYVRIYDNETFKHYCQQKRIQQYNASSMSNRQQTVPRTRNGSDIILHHSINTQTQRHLVYWRKGIFGLNRNCICGQKFTLSHSELCFGVHMPIEELLAQGDYIIVEYYIEQMWNTMTT